MEKHIYDEFGLSVTLAWGESGPGARAGARQEGGHRPLDFPIDFGLFSVCIS